MYNPFPLEMLPKSSLLRTYTEHMDANSESPPQYHFASMMCGISVLLGRKVSYPLGYHTLFPNVYMLVIGESGMTRKSSATRPILKAIRNINADLLLSTNFSNESLIPSFQRQPTRLMFLDEVRMLMDTASKSFGAGILTTITSIHECPSEIRSEFKKDYDEDGKLKNSSVAKYPFLSILGLTTQEWLNMSTTDISGGFLGRFLPILSIGEHQKTIAFPEADESFFTSISSKLEAVNSLNGKFKLDSATRPLWEKRYGQLMEETRSHKSDQFASFGSRMGDNLLKLCMLIASSMPRPSFDITPEIFESAYYFIDYFKVSYTTLLNELSTNQFSADENRLIKLLRKHGGRLSRTELMRAMHEKVTYIDEMARDLQEKRTLMCFKVKTDTRPRTDYFLTESFTWKGEHSQLFDQNGGQIGVVLS